MDEIELPQIPENLAELTDEQLAELGEAIGTTVRSLADQDPSDEVIAAIETMVEAADRIDAEAATREEANAEREERKAAALARFEPEASDEDADDDGDEDGDDETAETEAPEVTATEAAEVVAEAEEILETEPEAVAASAPRRPKAGTLARVKAGRPTPEPPAATRTGDFRADFHLAANVDTFGVGTRITTREQLGEMLAKKADTFRSSRAVDDGPITVARSEWSHPNAVTADPVANFGVFRQAIDQARSALVASGPISTPLSPVYDFFRLAVPQTPIEDALPTVGAPRGGVRYIAGNCSRTAGANAVTVQTDADNTDPSDPDLKNVLHVGTPTVAEEYVTAVAGIVEFGNLTYRAFPELVANFNEDVAVALASAKEVSYLDTIDAGSTAVTGVDVGYGFTRQLLWNITTAAANYRRRQGMRPEDLLQYLAPSWVVDAVKSDVAMSHEAPDYAISTAQVEEMFRRRNIAPIWHNDSTTAGGATQRFGSAQASGDLNEWPALVPGYLFAPGEWVRMDGGTLDLGIVRDSTLNRRNDLQIFMEEWTGLVHYGCETLKLIVSGVVNGVGAIGTDGYAPA